MIAIFSLQGAVLAIVSAASLSVFSAFCLWCRSKTITRPNQIIRELPPTPVEQTPQVVNEEQAKYQNVATAQMGSVEPTYVDPIPALVYQNVNESTNADTRDSETDGDQYENVFPSIDTISRGSDGSDYENSEFLEQVKMGLEPLEDDEPDYVNDTD